MGVYKGVFNKMSEKRLKLSDYTETNERGTFMKINIVDFLDDLIRERLERWLMMSEKRFRVRFEQEDGRGEIVNEKGVELTAREVVDFINNLEQKIKILQQEINDTQAILEMLTEKLKGWNDG